MSNQQQYNQTDFASHIHPSTSSIGNANSSNQAVDGDTHSYLGEGGGEDNEEVTKKSSLYLFGIFTIVIALVAVAYVLYIDKTTFTEVAGDIPRASFKTYQNFANKEYADVKGVIQYQDNSPAIEKKVIFCPKEYTRVIEQGVGSNKKRTIECDPSKTIQIISDRRGDFSIQLLPQTYIYAINLKDDEFSSDTPRQIRVDKSRIYETSSIVIIKNR
jgi:hypothetical protein